MTEEKLKTLPPEIVASAYEQVFGREFARNASQEIVAADLAVKGYYNRPLADAECSAQVMAWRDGRRSLWLDILLNLRLAARPALAIEPKTRKSNAPRK